MKNAINWFEIPASDFDRAVKFYGEILGAPVGVQDYQGTPMAFLPMDGDNAVGGAVILASDTQKPSADGTTIYLNANNDVAGVVSRAEKAGGKVVMPRTDIGQAGFIAIIIDTEGNKIGLHEPHPA
jgi:hypothetical protein